MQADGAGFAGFATWLDMTPGASGHLRHPRSRLGHPAALAKEVAWVAADCTMEDKPIAQAPARAC